jgi:hypothetical protein
MGGVSVAYTGELEDIVPHPATYDWSTAPASINSNLYYPTGLSASTWTSPSGGTYTGSASGVSVTSAPTFNFGQIVLYGGTGSTNTLTFSKAVVDPVIAIWSLGSCGSSDCGGGILASFVFNAAPVLISGGPSYSSTTGSVASTTGYPASQSISVSGNTVSGKEANGVVAFLGSYTSISWTNPTAEDHYNFTVGAATPVPNPEPSGWMLILFGGAAYFLIKRKRNEAQPAA